MSLFYFAYGADMNAKDVSHRCDMRRRNHVRFLAPMPAVLKGYRLVANVFCPERESGILNIAPDSQGSVEGVLFKLAAGDVISARDVAEGKPNTYRMMTVTMRHRKGQDVPTSVLIADVRGGSIFRLCDSYKTVVVKAAERHGLSPSWMKFLKALPTAPEGTSSRDSAKKSPPKEPATKK